MAGKGFGGQNQQINQSASNYDSSNPLVINPEEVLSKKPAFLLSHLS
jgi:hypothetical protein